MEREGAGNGRYHALSLPLTSRLFCCLRTRSGLSGIAATLLLLYKLQWRAQESTSKHNDKVVLYQFLLRYLKLI